MLSSPRGEPILRSSSSKGNSNSAALPMDSFLEKKFPATANNKLKIIVSTKDRSYEVEFDTTSQEIQKRINSFLKETKKKEEKGGLGTLRRGFSALTVNNSINQDENNNASEKEKIAGMASRARSGSINAPVRSLLDDKKLFGRHLETLMTIQRRTKKEARMPLFIEQLMNYVLLRGLNEESIFRVAPDRNALELARKQLDNGENIIPEKNTAQATMEIPVATGLIKYFFRELPEPVLTESLAPLFLAVGSVTSDEEAVNKIGQLIQQLPEVNRNILQHLLCLLWNISQNEKQNLMTTGNIATSIGPNLFATNPGAGIGGSLADFGVLQVSNMQRIVFLMVHNYHRLFAEHYDKLIKNENTNGLVWTGKRLVASQKSIHNVVSIKYPLGSGTQVISTSASTIKIWDSVEGTMLSKIENGNAYGHIFSVLTPRYVAPLHRGGEEEKNAHPIPPSRSWNSDPSEIWVASHRGIRIWSASSLEVKHTVESEYVNLALVKQFPDTGKKEVWAVRMQGDLIHRFDLNTYQLIGTVPVPAGNLFVVHFAENGYVWGGTYNGCITIWDTKGMIVKEHSHPEKYHYWKITCFSQTEEYIISGGDDGLVCVWDKFTLEFVKKISPLVGKLKCLTYFDGYLWACGWEPYMKIISKDFSRMQDTETLHTDSISSVSFVYNKTKRVWQAWTGSYDGTICVWSVPDKIMSD